ETGEIVVVSEEERALVEEERREDGIADWQREALLKVREALTNEKFLLLPGRFEVHEWAVMERFEQEQSEEVRTALVRAAQGSGPFSKFRGAVERLGLLEAWYRYRDQAIKQIACDWLEEHKLEYK